MSVKLDMVKYIEVINVHSRDHAHCRT